MKTSSARTVGVDLGDRKHPVCVLDHKGTILREETIGNTRGSLTALSRRHPGALVVMEVGMHSPWISLHFQALGYRVMVANPRKAARRPSERAQARRGGMNSALRFDRRSSAA
jgi:transposase